MRLNPPAMRNSTDAYRSALKRWMTRMSKLDVLGCARRRGWGLLRLLHRRPGLVDPGRRRARLALRPSRGRGDVADGDGDDARRIEDGERVLGDVLAESGDRVLVSLVVVRTDVHVAARTGIHHPLDLADERVVVGPAASELVRLLDGRLEHVRRGVGAFGLEVRVLVELGLVVLHELLVERPAVPRGIGEVVVRVHAGEDAFGMVLADRMGRGPQGERRRHLHLAEDAVLQRLLVEGDVVPAPERGDEEVRLL